MLNAKGRRMFTRLLTSALMIVALLVSMLGVAAAAPQTLIILGASGTAGATDPYTDYSMDGGATWQPAYLFGWHPWGFVPGTNSWLNCASNGEAAACLNRTVLYRIRFTLPAGSTNPQMVFDVKADNFASISVNGSHVADITGQGGTTADASITGTLHAGVNEIRLDVTDEGGWAGINYKITLNVDAPTPPTVGVPTITTSGNAVTVKAGTTGVVDAGVSLRGFDTISGATVTINSGFVASEDQLTFTNQNGITGAYNSSTGVLTLSGTASSATYQAALQSVTYRNTNPNSTSLSARTISFSVGAGTLFNAATGHFYQYVSSPGVSWTAARDAAANSSLFGLQGYLATMTSAAENSFAAAKLAGTGWIGASDVAQEGVWRWVTGPEAGIQFSGQNKLWYNNCAANTAPGVNGQYANWAGGEPNDCGGSYPGSHAEDYAHFYVGGTWNDYPGNAGVQGYVVEYGGMPGDSQPVLSANATVNVVDGAPPVTTVSATPTQPNGSVIVTLKATDNVTLLPVISYQLDGGPVQTGSSPVVTGGGIHELAYWSTDAAGNAETPKTVQISVDHTVVTPTVTVQTTPSGFTGPTAQLSGTAEPGSQVAVYVDADPAFANVAQGKPTSQSSWYNVGTYPGSAAVDGVVTGRFGAHTANGPAPWWQVDLGQPTALDRLVIWNRIDCCSYREDTLSVLFSTDGVQWTKVHGQGGASFGGLDPNGSGQLVQGMTETMTPAGGLVGPLKLYLKGTQARYIRLQVQNPGLMALNFDELQAFGTPAAPVATVPVDGDGNWSYAADHLSEGNHAVRVVAYGARGSAQSAPLLVKVDASAPATTAALSGEMGGNGWHLGPVTVNLSAADTLSGVQATYYKVDGAAQQPGTSVTVSGDGAHTVGYYSYDNVGNGQPSSFAVQGSARFWQDTGIDVPAGATLFVDASGTLMWDFRRPESATSPDGASGFPYPGFVPGARFSSLVARIGNGAGFEVGSNYQGIAQTGGRLYLAVNDCDCFGDNSGSWTANIAVGGTVSFKIDAEKPVITGQPDRAANAAGWYNADVTVSFTCTDNGSGVAACGQAQTLGEGADQSVVGEAADKAGNTASATVSGINIDKTAPVTTIAAPATWQ
ncbi:MAG: hypothetical protein K0R39_4001, partial [Symbiobacteriaceae bacterium]|nr:hypothetical protein [Symbiobacteriaceae bacterium]